MKTTLLLVMTALCAWAQNGPVPAGASGVAGRGGGGRGRGGPPVDPVAAARGKDVFGPSCAACHGLDSRGGMSGPDLGHSTVITEDSTGQSLAKFLKTGRPQNGMLAFPGVTDAQASDIVSFVRANLVQTRLPADAMLVGNAQAGAAYFSGEGKCSTCHSVTADLKGIGSKYDPMTLQGKIVWPRGRGRGGPAVPETNPVTVTVTQPSGEKISGVLVSSDDFIVILRDAAGVRRSVARLEKTRVEIKDPLQAHFDNLRKLTDKQMHDLTAYLVTIK